MSSTVNFKQQIVDIANFLQPYISSPPSVGIILGSGLGVLAEEIEKRVVIPYTDIPHLPRATAPGHAGNLILGEIKGKSVVAMQGRFHIYEGYTPHETTTLIRVMKKLGVDQLIITCAAGGLNYHFRVGEIMVITDHINFTGTNPLLGENLTDFGPRFPSMFDIYTQHLQDLAHKTALNNNVRLGCGVYAGVLGPCYSTRAELSYLIKNGCDAIGMSVIHEAIIAKHAGMQILGLAAITDMALPFAEEHITEDEVIIAAQKIATTFKDLIKDIIKQL